MEMDKQWHLDKRLNLGHILTTVIIVAAGISVVHGLDTRLTAAEVRIEETQRQHIEYQKQTRDALARIEMKLDRVIEREIVE